MTEHTVNRDQWVPANGETETPFTARNGQRLWYMWNRVTGEHAYLDVNSDVFLTQDEVEEAMGLR